MVLVFGDDLLEQSLGPGISAGSGRSHPSPKQLVCVRWERHGGIRHQFVHEAMLGIFSRDMI
jgi:hypothetical protein